jgi:crotonobetainyl-CoA:carnitine CoA-transferase CaiB-like acyl-CoA transferase
VLHGLRVLDLGRFVAAPYCGLLLADLGAEVIRVERPGGDEDRRLGLTGAHGENFVYSNLARNKLGITLDVRQPAGRALLFELLARADVFLHNFSPGAATSLGLGYDDVRAARADIIYTGISCYGTEGPHAERPGFDPMAQMASGAGAVSGHEGDAPLRAGVPWVDYATGLSAALGTVLALRQRDATGAGQRVDCALLQTAVSFMAPMIAEAVTAGRERPRLGNRAAYIGPSDLYRCRDGFVYVACATESAWRALMRLIGQAELLAAPDLDSHWARFEQRARVDPLVAAWLATRTVAEALAALDAAHVPCGPYRSTREVPDDAQVRAGGMLLEVDLGLPGLEAVPMGASPFRLSSAPARAATRAPRVGEHNRAVYEGLLGYTPERLARLQSDGIV